MDKETIYWEDFKMSIELHKFYLELTVKINFYYYAITGAILSFHFAKNSPDISLYSLLLPIFLSLFLGLFFLYAARLAWNLKKNIAKRAGKLDLESYPNGVVLVSLCIIFGVSMFGIGIALIIFLYQ